MSCAKRKKKKKKRGASDNDMVAMCYTGKMENLLRVTIEIVVKVEVIPFLRRVIPNHCTT